MGGWEKAQKKLRVNFLEAVEPGSFISKGNSFFFFLLTPLLLWEKGKVFWGGRGVVWRLCQSQIALGSIPCWDWTGVLLTPDGACLVFSLTKWRGVYKTTRFHWHIFMYFLIFFFCFCFFFFKCFFFKYKHPCVTKFFLNWRIKCGPTICCRGSSLPPLRSG